MGVGYLLHNQKPREENEAVTSKVGSSTEQNGTLVSIVDYANEVVDFFIVENKRSKRAREQQKTIIDTHKVKTIEE